MSRSSSCAMLRISFDRGLRGHCRHHASSLLLVHAAAPMCEYNKTQDARSSSRTSSWERSLNTLTTHRRHGPGHHQHVNLHTYYIRETLVLVIKLSVGLSYLSTKDSVDALRSIFIQSTKIFFIKWKTNKQTFIHFKLWNFFIFENLKEKVFENVFSNVHKIDINSVLKTHYVFGNWLKAYFHRIKVKFQTIYKYKNFIFENVKKCAILLFKQ